MSVSSQTPLPLYLPPTAAQVPSQQPVQTAGPTQPARARWVPTAGRLAVVSIASVLAVLLLWQAPRVTTRVPMHRAATSPATSNAHRAANPSARSATATKARAVLTTNPLAPTPTWAPMWA